MNNVMWRIKPEQYQQIRNCVPADFEDFSGREPAYVFVMDSFDPNRKREEITEWMVETGIEYGLSGSGNFRFIELYSESDAVMFKLRWA